MSESNTPKNSKRTEKVIISVALLLLLLSLGSLYFDDWLWSGLRSRSNSIGMITSKTGDVRLKFDQEVSWLKATTGQSLQYNDSVFAGPKSEADIKLGESQLTVTENSLVVLRREMDANFLNLNFGTLFGKVAKNEKVFIDTGAGQPTLLKTTSNAQIVLKKVGEKTSLEVVDGVAEIEINGVKKTVSKNNPIVLPSAPEAKAQVPRQVAEEQKRIEILPPSPTEFIFSKEAKEVNFKWSYGGETQVSSSDQFEVEFASEPSFQNPFRKYAKGVNEVSVYMARSNALYYRVKGPRGEVSPVNHFGFVRMFTPQIVTPVFDQEFSVKAGESQAVMFGLRSGPDRPIVKTQIAADPEFQTVLLENSGREQEWVKELPGGQYFARAQSDYGQGFVSDWSKTTYFKVKEARPVTRLPRTSLHREAVIENLNYPSHLYSAQDEEVKSYLKEKGFMRDFFVNLKDHYDQLAIDFGDGEIVNIKDSALPADKLYPSTLGYRYQLQKKGQLPSRWSPQESIRIRLEPPKSNGVHLVSEKLKDDGKVPVRVQFTPVLFAKNYEVQLADNSSFNEAQSLVGVSSAREFELEMNRDYYWKVRALDKSGRPLSDFSGVRKLSSNQFAKEIHLAKSKSAPKERKPAFADTRTETRSNLNLMNFNYRLNRFWAWLGSGFSYVNYQQSIAERGALDSASRNEMPGQYFEVGYVGENGYGGVLGYKSTPGEVLVDNAPLAEPKYNWRTISLEGFSLSRSKFMIFGLPIYYGPRAGIQSHSIPYVFLNSLDTLELRQNDMLTASLGMMAEAPRNRWRFHTYMRYQYPLTASSGSASEFSIKPKFAFDGLVGTSYYFSPQFKVGAFWYGQWHYYDFVYGDASITNRGEQSLFYSTMDVRFGFEF